MASIPAAKPAVQATATFSTAHFFSTPNEVGIDYLFCQT